MSGRAVLIRSDNEAVVNSGAVTHCSELNCPNAMLAGCWTPKVLEKLLDQDGQLSRFVLGAQRLIQVPYSHPTPKYEADKALDAMAHLLTLFTHMCSCQF